MSESGAGPGISLTTLFRFMKRQSLRMPSLGHRHDFHLRLKGVRSDMSATCGIGAIALQYPWCYMHKTGNKVRCGASGQALLYGIEARDYSGVLLNDLYIYNNCS